jgi:hypothetical protein
VTLGGPLLHPELASLGFLLGTWSGSGRGSYPGSSAFDYDEELGFAHGGKPLLVYVMQTSRRDDHSPSHGERGFWRCRNSAELDTVVAHATGHAEISVGSVDGNAVTLESTSVVGWRGSKEVLAISRRISLDGDVLTDALDMQAVGHDLQGHVVAELRRE